MTSDRQHRRSAAASLAKFTPPTVGEDILPRPRLFRRIDKAFASNRLVWVDGPAGAGKTMLAASYTAATGSAVAWTKLDAADSDPAAYFQSLSKALPATSEGRLPAFDGRIQQDPVAFARRFFGTLFACLPPGGILILDDHQEAGQGQLTEQLIAVAAEILPPDRHLLVLSRLSPPTTLAESGGRVERLDWDALRLNKNEAVALAKLRAADSSAVPEQLNHRVHGWVAGLVLLLQAAGAGLADANAGVAPETVNDYFTAEVLQSTDDERLAILGPLSLLPQFTVPQATELTGHPKAARLVADLQAQGYFVTRHESPGHQASFQFHPLFRQFLRDRMDQAFGPEQLNQVQRIAAAVAAKSDDLDTALDLYVQASAPEEAQALILEHAENLIETSRNATLLRWLDRLPESRLHANPYLLLWRGAARAPMDAAASRASLEPAYDGLRAAGDDTTALLALCVVVEGMVYEWGDMHRLDRWITAYAELAPAAAHVPTSLAPRVIVAMFSAMAYHRPHDPTMDDWAAQARDVFQRAPDAVTRVLIANQLSIFYAFMRGDMALASVFLDAIRVEAEQFDPPGFATVAFETLSGVIGLWNDGSHGQAAQSIQRALSLADESGFHLMDFLACACGAWIAISARDLEEADRYLQRLSATPGHEAPLNQCVLHDTRAIRHLHAGRLDQARAEVGLSLDLANRGGMPYAKAACLLTASRISSLRGEYDGAAQYRAEARAIARAMDNKFIEHHLRWFEAADLYARREHEAARKALADALSLGQGFFANLWLDQDTLAELCTLGLEAGFDTAHMRRLVLRHHLKAPGQASTVANWPFRLRIHALRGLDVKILTDNGYRPIPLRGRTGQLLEALVRMGGDNVPQEALTDLLWPEAEGDAARRSFDTTLHRLRRSLDDDQLIGLEGGRLSLDAGYCWTDVGSAELAAEEAVRAMRTEAPTEALATVTSRLLALTVDIEPTGAPHHLQGQDRQFRRHVRRTLDQLGQYWAGRKDWQQAINTLEEAVRIDPTAESAYVHLMEAYLVQGLSAEALSAYQLCQHHLQSEFGIDPGPELQALRGQITGSRG